MEILFIIIICLITVSMFLPWSKWLGNVNLTYEDGYDSAIECITKKNGNPQELYDQAVDEDYDNFDRGWLAACVENGAEIKE